MSAGVSASRIRPDVTCRELVEFLDDYLSGALSEEDLRAFNAHLAACPSCVAYLKTYQATIQAGRAALARNEEDPPEDVPEGLIQAILAARKKAGGP
jgi:anti-sigma factor RsiW